MSKVQIFNIYHKHAPLIKSECIRPIQTGCAAATELLGPEFLRDDTGDNISNKNPHYAELTAHYWVWKNVLPNNPDLQYVGFCHYRRILDFWASPEGRKSSWRMFRPDRFSGYAGRYVDREILPAISAYDIVLPAKYPVKQSGFATAEEQFKYFSPADIWETARAVIREEFPEYMEDFDDYCHSPESYYLLNFVMRKDLFAKYAEWEFALLAAIEKRLDWSKFDDGVTIKNPALLIERLINVWIMHEIRVNKIKVLERQRYTMEGALKRLVKIGGFFIEKLIYSKSDREIHIGLFSKLAKFKWQPDIYSLIPKKITRVSWIAKKRFGLFVRRLRDANMQERRAFLVHVPERAIEDEGNAIIAMIERLTTEYCMVAAVCDIPCMVSEYCDKRNVPCYSNMTIICKEAERCAGVKKRIEQLHDSFDGVISLKSSASNGIGFAECGVEFCFSGFADDFRQIIAPNKGCSYDI